MPCKLAAHPDSLVFFPLLRLAIPSHSHYSLLLICFSRTSGSGRGRKRKRRRKKTMEKKKIRPLAEQKCARACQQLGKKSLFVW
jgi:hypothetical protein